jgi:predicted ATPase
MKRDQSEYYEESNNLKFSINNFRVFGKQNNFELAPITILTGPNNSGKSSLVKSLKLLTNNQVDGRLRNYLNFSSNKSNLYSRENIFSDEKRTLDYSFEINVSELSETAFNYQFAFDYNGSLSKFAITQNRQILLSYTYHNNSFDYSDISLNISHILELFGVSGNLFELENEDLKIFEEIKMNLYSELEKKVVNEFSVIIANDSSCPVDGEFAKYAKKKIVLYADNYFSANRHSTINQVNEALLIQIFEYLEAKLKERLEANGLINMSLKISNNGSSLKEKLLLLIRSMDILLLEIDVEEVPVNRNMQNRNIDLTDESILLNVLTNKYLNNVHPNDPREYGNWFVKWLKKFDIGKCISVKQFNREIANIVIHDFNGKERDLSACGTGVTQIITLLLLPLLKRTVIESLNERVLETNELVLENEKWLFYLEEPESNLHPNWQSLLMELIIEMNELFLIKFIIETHSEYLVRKLQYIMADNQKNICEDTVLIYYFNSDKHVNEVHGEPKVKRIKVDQYGNLSDNFGPGFYDEAINLEFELLKIRKYQNN